MAAKLSQSTKDEFIARYVNGENLNDLAILLSINTNTCRKLLRNNNIEIRERTRVLPSEQENRKQAIRLDYENGMTTEELMTKYKRSRSIINNLIQDLFLANVLERNSKIIRLHEEGLTLRQIAEIVDLCHAQVSNILDNLDIPRSTFPHLKINHNRLIDETPELFYWVGWAITDGTIGLRGNYRYKLGLQFGDKHIIERFASWLEVDRFNLITFQPKQCTIQNREVQAGQQCVWGVTNEYFKVWVDKYGIVPNKTYNFVEPQIPDEYFGDYLRGVIEGDGSIRLELNNRIYHISVAGNLPFLDWLTNKLRYFGYTAAITFQKRNDVYGVINMQGKHNIGWLYNFCHANNPLRLDRKWSKLDQFYN